MHAHIKSVSQDCDGEYRRGHVHAMTSTEQTSDNGEYDFRTRVLSSTVSTHGYGRLHVTPMTLVWDEDTDEGYVHVEVRFCDSTGCDTGTTGWFRDMSAEKAGY